MKNKLLTKWEVMWYLIKSPAIWFYVDGEDTETFMKNFEKVLRTMPAFWYRLKRLIEKLEAEQNGH